MKNTFYGKTNFFFQRDFFGKIGKKRTLFYYSKNVVNAQRNVTTNN